MSQRLLFICLVLLFGFDVIYSASLEINSDEDNINYNTIDLSFSNKEYGINDDGLEPLLTKSFSTTFPGTKWCGPGNIAEDYDDISTEMPETDSCCREHDHCNNTILGHSVGYGLENKSFYTRLSCECDEKFHDCLINANDKLGKIMGNIYFNLIGTKCFKKEYPVVCSRYKSGDKKKCLEYERDTTQPMIYQWFNVPYFP